MVDYGVITPRIAKTIQNSIWKRAIILATKKQKRAAALAKREAWVKERIETGLKAQHDDHENRKNKQREKQREKHNKEHSWKALEKECVLCMDKLEEARRQQKNKEVAESG